MSFVRRRIKLRFQLGQGDFGEAGFDTFEVDGLRVQATISKVGGVSNSQCVLRAHGLPLDVMNKLSILGKAILQARENVLTVFAGDDDNGLSVAFQGTIFEAWIDGRGAPDLSLIITATSAYTMQVAPAAPTSYKGTVDAATVGLGIATQAGFAFENSGVDVQFPDPYFHGSLQQQLVDLKLAADCNLYIDGEKDGGTIAMWPKGGLRGGLVPDISPDTGLVGYPELAEAGISVMTLYNPSVVVGGQFKLKSLITRADGLWPIISVAHDLESETPGGKWFTTVGGTLFGATLTQGTAP
jgi:hypothetical protein